ncbi:hypothetical protein ACFVZ3_07215 [Kitasatospora purpeofusca]|uniref:hypothetical protein n=1 Tax=Kitasatospora purpeofusca TaxID=67352 RepID=UPI0036CA5CFA
MAQDDRHKYLCYAWRDNREQLFDLAKDPGEMIDLGHVSGCDQSAGLTLAIAPDPIDRVA